MSASFFSIHNEHSMAVILWAVITWMQALQPFRSENVLHKHCNHTHPEVVIQTTVVVCYSVSCSQVPIYSQFIPFSKHSDRIRHGLDLISLVDAASMTFTHCWNLRLNTLLHNFVPRCFDKHAGWSFYSYLPYTSKKKKQKTQHTQVSDFNMLYSKQKKNYPEKKKGSIA